MCVLFLQLPYNIHHWQIRNYVIDQINEFDGGLSPYVPAMEIFTITASIAHKLVKLTCVVLLTELATSVSKAAYGYKINVWVKL